MGNSNGSERGADRHTSSNRDLYDLAGNGRAGPLPRGYESSSTLGYYHPRSGAAGLGGGFWRLGLHFLVGLNWQFCVSIFISHNQVAL
uniref:Uncharacterized protein n=1 Tax=Panagrellus redivivus TaxID=6233 RepID=A0A7E4VJ49_PANRE